MDELRELLQAWRDAKKAAWQAVVSWVVRIVLALLVLGMSVRLGLLELSEMRFAGYAAIFDRPDRGGDVVRAGAFARSLKRGAGAVPLLWQHEPARPVGRIEYLREDGRGLRVIARLSAGAAGREAAALLKEGAVAG